MLYEFEHDVDTLHHMTVDEHSLYVKVLLDDEYVDHQYNEVLVIHILLDDYTKLFIILTIKILY